jgi:DNA-binding NarL/FixJ family response regulator
MTEFAYRGIDRRRSQRAGIQLAVVVVDSAFRVKYSSAESSKRTETERLLAGDTRLRPEVEALVSSLIREGRPDANDAPRVVLLDEHRALRISPLIGPEETLYALIVGTNHNRDSLVRAASRYQLTRRQSEVLALILEGYSVSEIADELCISENTAQGYVKTLLSKTKSRNRPSMVAKVLEWHPVRPVRNGGLLAEGGFGRG